MRIEPSTISSKTLYYKSGNQPVFLYLVVDTLVSNESGNVSLLLDLFSLSVYTTDKANDEINLANKTSLFGICLWTNVCTTLPWSFTQVAFECQGYSSSVSEYYLLNKQPSFGFRLERPTSKRKTCTVIFHSL